MPGMHGEVHVNRAIQQADLVIGVGLLNLILVQPKGLSGDGYYRYLQLNELLRTGTLPDGDYSLVGPSFAAPMWLIGHAFGNAAMSLHNTGTPSPSASMTGKPKPSAKDGSSSARAPCSNSCIFS